MLNSKGQAGTVQKRGMYADMVSKPTSSDEATTELKITNEGSKTRV